MAETKIAIDKIKPNPYQPESRINIDEEEAKRFGLSILEHGMILTPVGRKRNGEGTYEMGDGWLRLKGHEWLVNNGHPEFQEIRFDERELPDQQMADLVLEANKIRKDLNPIEEALFYKKYIESFKVTQAELAKKHNVSQGEIANTLRLLELPQPVQDKVISREITSTHARQLLKLNPLPEKQERFVQATVKEGLSVSQLDVEINRDLYRSSKPLDKRDRYEKPLFNTKECDTCEFRMVIADPWGDRKKQPRCTKPDCWEEKQELALEQIKAEAQKKLEDNPEGQKILTSDELSYDQFQRLDSYGDNYKKILDNPAECDSCPKRGLYKRSLESEVKPENVCLDPKCYRAKKTRRTKAENKQRKELDNALTLRLGEIFEKTSKNRYGCLVIAAKYTIKLLSASALRDIALLFPDVPKHSNGRLNPDALRAKFYGMAEPELIKLLSAMLICYKRRANYSEDYSTELKEDQLMEIAILEGNYETKSLEVIAFQEANCQDCGNANKDLVSTGEQCCTYTYNRKIKNGVCQNSPHTKELKGNQKEKEVN